MLATMRHTKRRIGVIRRFDRVSCRRGCCAVRLSLRDRLASGVGPAKEARIVGESAAGCKPCSADGSRHRSAGNSPLAALLYHSRPCPRPMRFRRHYRRWRTLQFDIGADEDAIHRMAELFARHGDIYRFYSPGAPRRNVGRSITRTTSNACWSSNHRNYTKGAGLDRVKILLGNGIMTSEGDLWKRQRYMMQPFFHRRVITRVRRAHRRLQRAASSPSGRRRPRAASWSTSPTT